MIKRLKYDISIYRGDTPKWKFTINTPNEQGELVPVDLSEYTIRGQARYSSESDEIWHNFDIVITDPKSGVFQFGLTKDQSTSLLPPGGFEPDSGIYDIQLEHNNNVFTFLHGSFRVTRDITR